MTIDITLGRAMNFNAELESFIDGFVSSGFPYFEQDDQMLIVNEVQGAATPIFVLDGSKLEYELASHTVSGAIDTITLGELGGSYNADGSFDLDANGHISGYTAGITLDGLGLANAPGVRGVVHEIVAELMYLGGSSERGAETLLGVVWGEGHAVTGSNGNDGYTGTRFADSVAGRNGHDTLAGATGHDTVDGGSGNDQLGGGANNDRLLGNTGNDRLSGDAGNDILYGGTGGDVVDGGTGNDRLFGDDGNDQILGGAGADVIAGGGGRDALTGGGGSDRFVYTAAADSTPALKDAITDFAAEDLLDLAGVDANANRGGNQAFSLVDAFTGTAGELLARVTAGGTTVYGDTDGDGTSDLTIVLQGYKTPVGNDFVF